LIIHGSRFGIVLLAFGAALASGVALWHLLDATAELHIERLEVGTTPVTVFRPATADLGPAVVIAHGFAGSQALMLPFATTLARNGYTAITFDFPGHGRNPVPLEGGIADHEAAGQALLASLDGIVEFARKPGLADGRVALLGHSMASEIVVRHAVRHPEVAATVGVSLFSRDVTADLPRNLLVIVGNLEPDMLKDEGYRIARMATGSEVREGITYGVLSEGTARRVAFARGVEHIGVLYSPDSLRETLAWLNETFGRQGNGFIDRRGPWLLLLFAGIVALARVLAPALPSLARQAGGIRTAWRQWLPVAVAPAILTPLLLWKVPTDFMPLLLGDYLLLHFGLYGMLTIAAMAIAGVRRPDVAPVRTYTPTRFAIAVLAASAFAVLAIALPMDALVSNFVPTQARLPLLGAMLCGTLPWFIADEWLTRGSSAPRGAYPVTKILFLASLLFAIALNLPKLFFLIIIVPAILAFFLVYGLFSRWAHRSTGQPLVGGIANAVAFAWAIAVTFPVVAR